MLSDILCGINELLNQSYVIFFFLSYLSVTVNKLNVPPSCLHHKPVAVLHSAEQLLCLMALLHWGLCINNMHDHLVWTGILDENRLINAGLLSTGNTF